MGVSTCVFIDLNLVEESLNQKQITIALLLYVKAGILHILISLEHNWKMYVGRKIVASNYFQLGHVKNFNSFLVIKVVF